MTDISRRGFLGGVAAAAAVAALPIPAPLPETYPMVFEPGPIFEGAVGTYNGVLIREVWAIDLNACARSALAGWVKKESRRWA